ncbi:MAG: tetratricopeptide repeat protein [Gemmatimonadota bacterium]|nr:tetratricopeptide repeat protein [Gemmatimonadota bacterium]
MTSARVDPLRAEFEAIRAALAAARTPAERADIKRRLMAVFREADSRLQDLGQLKDDIRVLVEQWRQAVAPDPEEGPRLAIVRPAIRQDRLGASTFIEKGWHLISLGDHAGAIAALQRALELAPNDTQAQGLLGWAQMLGEQYDEAMGTFPRSSNRIPAMRWSG